MKTRRLHPAAFLAALSLACSACESNKNDGSDVWPEPDIPIQPDQGTDPDKGTNPDPGGDPGQDVPSNDCTDVPSPLRGMAQECQTDCDCEPDLFCYDEAYTAPYKICTRECGSGCPGNDQNKFKCVQFSSKPKYYQDKYGITIMTICMPYCLSLEDCKVYGDFYGYCPGKSAWTEWDDITIGPTTCQVKQL